MKGNNCGNNVDYWILQEDNDKKHQGGLQNVERRK